MVDRASAWMAPGPLGSTGVRRRRCEGQDDTYGGNQAACHRLAPVRVLATPEEEHLPRPLVIDSLFLQIGLRLVGRMESQEGGAPPVVTEREAIRVARRRPSAGDVSGWPPSQVVNVGSVRGCPLTPWRQIAYGLNLSPIWCSRVGVGFGGLVITQKRAPGLITVKWAAAVVGRVAAAESITTATAVIKRPPHCPELSHPSASGRLPLGVDRRHLARPRSISRRGRGEVEMSDRCSDGTAERQTAHPPCFSGRWADGQRDPEL